MRCTAHRLSFATVLFLVAQLAACGEDGSGDPSAQGDNDVRESPDTERDLGDTARPDAGEDVDEADDTDPDDTAGADDDAEADGLDDPNPDDTSLGDTGDGSGGGPLVCDPPPTGYGPTEICGDGLDNDNDTHVDEDCPCTLGSTQPCFPGDPAQIGIGQCLPGVQICSGSGSEIGWGECQGGFMPSTEVCDAKDNDCDGCVDDELIDCVPSFTCPVEDTARPLSYYTLNGPDILAVEGATGWSWSVVPPRNSGTTGPENPTAANTRVFLDVSGDYIVSVTAYDEKGAAFGCSWIVRAQGDGLRVELNWDTMGQVDLDLHLHRSGTTTDWCTPDDCYYANCNVSYEDEVEWGYPNSSEEVCITDLGYCPNPRLDLDNIRRVGTPENINVDNPEPNDTFRIMVHNFSQATSPTRGRVSIYCGGHLEAVLGEPPFEAVFTDAEPGCMGDTWRVADVRMTEDSVTGAYDCQVLPLLREDGNWDMRNDDKTF